MTRILYTAFDIVPSPKGASTHILHNLRGLVNGNFDVHLLTPSDGVLPLEDSIDGVPVTRVSQDLTQNFLARAVHFGTSVFNHITLHPEYDVVHYRNIWDGLSIAQNKTRFGYKTVFEVNGLPSIELKYHYPGLDSDLLSKIKEQEIATLHLSDAIICPSNVTRDYIASLGLNRRLVTVIPTLIADSDICVAPLGLNDRNVTQGACPIKVLEYMAAARPLVASNMPIVRELIREDIDALLFSPNDPDDLARQAILLLNDFKLSERLAASASERALTRFTWHESQKKLGKVYTKLLSH